VLLPVRLLPSIAARCPAAAAAAAAGVGAGGGPDAEAVAQVRGVAASDRLDAAGKKRRGDGTVTGSGRGGGLAAPWEGPPPNRLLLPWTAPGGNDVGMGNYWTALGSYHQSMVKPGAPCGGVSGGVQFGAGRAGVLLTLPAGSTAG